MKKMYKKPNSEKTELLGGMIMQTGSGVNVNNSALPGTIGGGTEPGQYPTAD